MFRDFTRGRTWRPVFLLLAFAILTAACAGAPGAQTPGAPAGSGPAGVPTQAPPADGGGGVPVLNCQTLSGTDLAAIVGKDVAEANPLGDLSCDYVFEGSASVASGSPDVRVYVRFLNDDATLGSWKEAYSGEDVSIGDRGYWAEGDSTLFVAKGAHAYGISLRGFDPTDPRKEMAIEIARLLLAKV